MTTSSATPKTDPATDPKATEPQNTKPSAADWRAGLAKEYLEHPSLKEYKDVNGVVKTLLSAQEALGSRVKMPEKDAPDEEWEKFYAKMGRPAKPEEYSLEGIENAEVASADSNAELLNEFRTWAHSYGLSQRQMAGITDKFLGLSRQIAEDRARAAEENVAMLRREYGASFDARVSMANETMKTMVQKAGGDWSRVSKALADSGMDTQPDLVMAFSAMGRMMSQDKLWGAGGEPRSMGGLSRSEARAQIEELKAKHVRELASGSPEGRVIQEKINSLLDIIGSAG